MKANISKNLKNRQLFFKSESLKRVNKFLQINLLNNKKRGIKLMVLNLSLLLLSKSIKKFSSIRFNNKCVFTGRNKSVERARSISRIRLLGLMRFGIIPGYSKAVW